MTESKILEIKLVGLEEAIKNVDALTTKFNEQRVALAELKSAKEKDLVAIEKQKIAIEGLKAEIKTLNGEIANEVKERVKRAALIDKSVQTELSQLTQLGKYYEELENRSKQYYNSDISNKQQALAILSKNLQNIRQETDAIEYDTIGQTNPKGRHAIAKDQEETAQYLKLLQDEALKTEAAIRALSNVKMGGTSANINQINNDLTETNFELLQMREYYKQMEVDSAKQAKVVQQNEAAEKKLNNEKERQIALDAKNAADAAKKVGYINELKIEVGQLEQRYYSLSKAELEDTNVGGKVLNDLTARRAELSKLQQAYGNHSLNVGNYSSATKMLGINIGQVMKEMPNFAISARIGIMSLTNNLPMLAESIKAVKLEQQAMMKTQEALIAQGKIAEAQNMKIPSMWKMIGSSIFGVTGIMSIAMVLMQIFGADIIKWVGSLFKGKQAIEDTTTAFYAMNKVMQDGGGSAKTTIEHITKLGIEITKFGDNSKYTKGIIDDFNKTFNTHYTTINEVKKAYPNMADAAINAAIKMAAADELISKSSQQLLRQKGAENVLSQYRPDQVSKTEQALNRVLAARKKFLIEEKNMSESAAQVEVNKLWEDILSGKMQESKLLGGFNIFRTKEWTKLRQDLQSGGSEYESVLKDMVDISDNAGTKISKALLDRMGSKTQMAKLKTTIDSLSQMVVDDTNTTNNTVKDASKATFDWEQKLREANAKSIEDDLFKQAELKRADYLKRQEDLDEALKKEPKKRKEYDELTLLNVQQLMADITDVYAKGTDKQIDEIKRLFDADKNARGKSTKDKERSLLRGMQAEIDVLDMTAATKEIYGKKDLKAELDLIQKKKEYEKNNKYLELKEAGNSQHEINAAMAAIDAYYEGLKTQKKEQVFKEDMDRAFQYANSVKNVMSGLNDFTTALGDRELANWAKINKGKAGYDEAYAKKKAKLDHDAAVRGKAMSIMGATISTAEAVINALTTKPAAAGLALAILAGITGAAQIATIIATPIPDADISSSSSSNVTSTVTEKFHTSGTIGEKPLSPLQRDEVTATLLKGERVLSLQQTGVFNSILGNIKSMGGSSSITNGVGVNNMNQLDMMTLAFSMALQNQKPQNVVWKDYKDFESKMVIFEQNKQL